MRQASISGPQLGHLSAPGPLGRQLRNNRGRGRARFVGARAQEIWRYQEPLRMRARLQFPLGAATLKPLGAPLVGQPMTLITIITYDYIIILHPRDKVPILTYCRRGRMIIM